MNMAWLIALVIGLVVGYVICIFATALTLVKADEDGKIVFIDQDEIKNYLVVVGILNDNFATKILYKDRKLTVYSLRNGSPDFLKDLNLEDHK